MKKALDLFCGAGGVTKGLQRAGLHVTGIDLHRQPRYCGDAFVQADALKPPFDLKSFDFIWASPPCQAYTQSTLSQRRVGKSYPDLMSPTRDMLAKSGRPYVIENTPGAPMRVDIVLCGSMFGLRLIRHRWFECSMPMFFLIPTCQHHPNPCVVVGHGTTSWARSKNGGKCHSIEDNRRAMGIDWMNRGELSQAIPPAYSEFLGRQIMKILERKPNDILES